MSRAWAILTGEYPPQTGGVADYTELVARGLAASGEQVTVWAPPVAGAPATASAQVRVRRLTDRFEPRSLRILGRELDEHAPNATVLVQYVPHAFGLRNMNLPFAAWLERLGARRDVWVMFHEVAYPWTKPRAHRHNVLAAAQRLMAALVVRRAARVFVSTTAWERLLRPLAPRGLDLEWLPGLSNIAVSSPLMEVQAVRERALAGAPGPLLGHFGTYGRVGRSALSALLTGVLAASRDASLLLLGRGGPGFAQALESQHPGSSGRIRTTGALSATEVAVHLRACDLLLQPYAEGVTTRRGSLMAGLALGLPIVTTTGVESESIWLRERCVALFPASRPDLGVSATVALLSDAAARARLGARAANTYEAQFSLARSLERLRRSCGPAPSPDVPTL